MSSQEAPVFARPTPVEALLRWWPLAVVAALLGGLIGFYAGRVGPVTYTAEARVAVGAGDLTSGAIAGFPLAAEQLASNYSRYVNDQMLTGTGAADAGGGATAVVSATPIPDSNVIRVLAVSDSSTQGRRSAEAVAEKLVNNVNASSAASSGTELKPYQDAVAAWSSAQRRLARWRNRFAVLNATGVGSVALKRAETNVFKLSQTVEIAGARKDAFESKYEDSLTASNASKLLVVQRAVLTGSDRSSRLQRYSLLGVVSGVVVALLAANLIERIRRPRRRLRSA